MGSVALEEAMVEDPEVDTAEDVASTATKFAAITNVACVAVDLLVVILMVEEDALAPDLEVALADVLVPAPVKSRSEI